MSESLTREIGLLRALAAHLERRPRPIDRVTNEFLRREGFGHVREKEDCIIAIRVPGHRAFTDLGDCILDRLPAMERGAIYDRVNDELFSFIEGYVGRAPSTVGRNDAEGLLEHFVKWFAEDNLPRRVFVPCVLSRTPAPRFEIGPVAFEFIDHVLTSDFYPREDRDRSLNRHSFDKLMQWMREHDADWLARASVVGCDRKRSEEVAEIAVDLAIVALQLAAPYLDTRTMTRLDARRGTLEKRILSEADGSYSASWTRKEPGMSIGQGTLIDILQKAAPLFTAVGNVVSSFASGSFRLPNLERAWCDAAYWFHQALVETIDAIAIAKLETALEVLLRTESSKRGTQRVLGVLNAFFELSPDDPIAPGSALSAQQFAHNVVRDRSRILHGTWSTLNTRGINRAGMEGFVTTVLRRAVIEFEAYAHSAEPADDIDGFLDWVRQRKAMS